MKFKRGDGRDYSLDETESEIRLEYSVLVKCGSEQDQLAFPSVAEAMGRACREYTDCSFEPKAIPLPDYS